MTDQRRPRRTQTNSLPAVSFQDGKHMVSFLSFGDGKLFIASILDDKTRVFVDLPPIEIERLRAFLDTEFPRMELPTNVR